MIEGLFETHIEVSSLEKAMKFYEGVFGLELGHIDKERRIAFYWLTKRGQAMLGLWETPIVNKRHFAFHSSKEWILNSAVSFLKNKNLYPYNFLKDGQERPMVFCWMPAIAVYFNDPDGNVLEFISMLPGNPKPELGVVSYEEWLSLSGES